MNEELPTDPEVRRLLADARADGGVPSDVALRLDEVLAGLVAERADGAASPDTRVVPLSGRRRRRVLGWAVAAAAAVVVGGVAVGQLVPFGAGSGDDSGGATAAQESQADTGAPLRSPQQDGLVGGTQVGAVPALGSATLEQDLLLLRPLAPPASARRDLRARGCLPPGPGSLAPVTLDGRDAALALRPLTPAGQPAEVYLCGEDAPAASVVLPAP